MTKGDIGTYSIPERRITTPNGDGTMINLELPYGIVTKETDTVWPRYGVILDNNPFHYPVAYYSWKNTMFIPKGDY